VKYFVTVGEKEFEIFLNGKNGDETLEVDGTPLAVDLQPIPGASSVYSLLVEGKSYDVWAETQNGNLLVAVDGDTFVVRVEDERSRLIKKIGGEESDVTGVVLVKAPMPGLIVRVEVAEGDWVEKGQGVVVVEAMKMENEIKAPISGKVKSVREESGTAIEKNAVLLEIEAE